ncbi:hypothetical protein F5884DRAFT_851235 [Xylogone sp. PMI_703]|nr:hypothetical protein F5884DRAFT_851235 [Xylogone sp. PMI_703]
MGRNSGSGSNFSHQYEPVEENHDQDTVDLQNAKPYTSPVRSTRGSGVVFWILVVLNLLALALVYRYTVREDCACPARGGSRTLNVLDQIPMKSVIFKPDSRFSGNPVDKNSPWQEMNPMGHGFIEIAEPWRWGLEGGHPMGNPSLPGSEGYLISMYHQLHCLAAIKAAVAGIKHNKPEHLNHCFDYIRQGIMCAGDLTLEPTSLNGVQTNGASGWDVEHYCKDWDAVYSYASRHAVNNRTSIL